MKSFLLAILALALIAPVEAFARIEDPGLGAAVCETYIIRVRRDLPVVPNDFKKASATVQGDHMVAGGWVSDITTTAATAAANVVSTRFEQKVDEVLARLATPSHRSAIPDPTMVAVTTPPENCSCNCNCENCVCRQPVRNAMRAVVERVCENGICRTRTRYVPVDEAVTAEEPVFSRRWRPLAAIRERLGGRLRGGGCCN